MSIFKEKYGLRRGEPHKSLNVSEGDHAILLVYADLRGTSITHVIHNMIGTAAKCWEEKHDTYIKRLEIDLKGAEKAANKIARELLRYQKHFGKIPDNVHQRS